MMKNQQAGTVFYQDQVYKRTILLPETETGLPAGQLRKAIHAVCRNPPNAKKKYSRQSAGNI